MRPTEPYFLAQIKHTDPVKVVELAKNYAKENGYTIEHDVRIWKKWSWRKFRTVKYYFINMWKSIDFDIK